MKKLDTQELCGRLDESRGYNMNTCSGEPVWPIDPRPEDIRIDDIAGSLSRICRFNGHLKDCQHLPASAIPYNVRLSSLRYSDDVPPFMERMYEWPIEVYSVAQHSSLVCDLIETEDPILKLAALLHDAPEFVLGDMIKPQKTMYAERKPYEDSWARAVEERYNLPHEILDDPRIKRVDYRIFLTEKRDLLIEGSVDFGVAKAEPYDIQIVPVWPSHARSDFLTRFKTLYKGE